MLGMSDPEVKEDTAKRLMKTSSAIAILCALEFGYKAHERGINLQQAREELFDLLKEPTS